MNIHFITCPRCGTFRLEEAVVSAGMLSGGRESLALCLSAGAREATDRGDPFHIDLNMCTANTAAPSGPRTMSEYADRVLLDLAAQSKHRPGTTIKNLDVHHLAARAFLPHDSCDQLLAQMVGARLLNKPGSRAVIQLDGWRRIDELTRTRPHVDRAFVAMWFDGSMAAARAAIEGALVACGYTPPFLVDDPLHEAKAGHPEFKNKIDDRILAEIRRARFVVADVTGARPSVYYEAGFADGLGTPVIWTCDEAKKDEMAFDTRQNGHILWKTSEDLGAQLEAKVRARGWAIGGAES